VGLLRVIVFHSLSELLELVKQYLVSGWVLIGGSGCVNELLESLPGNEEVAGAVIVYKCGYTVRLVMLRREVLSYVLGDKATRNDLEGLVALDLFVKEGRCYGRLIGPGRSSERQAFIEDFLGELAKYLERDEVEKCTDLAVM